MLSEFGVILIFIVAAILLVGVILYVSKFVSPRRPNAQKLAAYESGEQPVENAWQKFNIKYYTIALVFLLFEAELIFLFPWATIYTYPDLIAATHGMWVWFCIIEMTIFISILALGIAYVWYEGYFDWIKGDLSKHIYNQKVPDILYQEFNNRY